MAQSDQPAKPPAITRAGSFLESITGSFLESGEASVALSAIVVFNQLGGWPNVARWNVWRPTAEGAVWAFVIFCYVPFSARVPRWLSLPVAQVGIYSYSFYLLHFVGLHVLPRLHPLVLSASPNADAIRYAFTWVLPSVLALSALSYHVVERPFLSLRVKYLKGKDD